MRLSEASAPRDVGPAGSGADDVGEEIAAPDSPDTLGGAARAFFRYPSPWLLAVLVVATAATRVAVGGWSIWDLPVLVAVMAFWPFQEWLLHVALLHMKPLTIFSRTIDFEFARRHQAHHLEPWRLELILLPVWVHLLAPLLVLLFLATLPTPELAFTAMATYTAMALQYEWVHFLVHTRYRPRRRHFKRLWHHHRLHHFRSERYWFGFTVVAVDRMFGTAPEPGQVATSPTCRTLGRS